MSTVEKKVADTILQKEKSIWIGGANYEVAPPSIATLILASSVISELPEIEIGNNDDILSWSLKNARHCGLVGDIVAIIILGAKGVKEKKTVKRLFRKKEIVIDHKKILSKKLLEDLTPKQLYDLAIELFNKMEIGSFFGLTTFLLEVNLTKPTRRVETVSGQ